MRSWIWVVLLAVVWVLVLLREPIAAGAQVPTPFPTPTPLPDGRIVYIVQPGDTPWRIAAIAGITVEELYALNNLDEGDILRPGEAIILGYALPGFPTPTPGPTPTPSPILPTPTKVPGYGTVCVLLFDDRNGNGMFDEDLEILLAGGTISLRDRRGQITQTGITSTDMDNPTCFEDIPAGVYQVSMGIPQGFNPTTQTDQRIQVLPGNTVYVSFGAQPSAETGIRLMEEENDEGWGLPAWLGLVGFGMLLAGGVLLWVAVRLRRPFSRSTTPTPPYPWQGDWRP